MERGRKITTSWAICLVVSVLASKILLLTELSFHSDHWQNIVGRKPQSSRYRVDCMHIWEPLEWFCEVGGEYFVSRDDTKFTHPWVTALQVLSTPAGNRDRGIGPHKLSTFSVNSKYTGHCTDTGHCHIQWLPLLSILSTQYTRTDIIAFYTAHINVNTSCHRRNS